MIFGKNVNFRILKDLESKSAEVQLLCMCVQHSENVENRKNALKHLRTMLETIVDHVEVLHSPITSLTCNPPFWRFWRFWHITADI